VFRVLIKSVQRVPSAECVGTGFSSVDHSAEGTQLSVRFRTDQEESDFTRDHDCVIRAAMFDDGSFEGDPEPAARFRAYVIGRKIQLRRVVALLQEALDSRDEVIPTLQRFRAGLSVLNASVDGDEAQALLEEVPEHSVNSKASLKSSINAALGSIKKITGEELNEFEKAQAAAPDKTAFRSWLLASKEKYAGWLSRL
jgi:hypothetical protein